MNESLMLPPDRPPSPSLSTRTSSSSIQSLHSTLETLSLTSHNGLFHSPLPPNSPDSNPFFATEIYPTPPHLTPLSSPSPSFVNLPTLLHSVASTPSWPESIGLGKLTVVVVQARGLNVEVGENGEAGKPYCLMQYDRTDTVSLAYGDSLQGKRGHGLLSGMRGIPGKGSGHSPLHHSPLAPSAVIDRGTPSSPVWNHEASFDVVSPSRTILLCVYDKLAPQGGYPAHGFLGAAVFQPRLDQAKEGGSGQDFWVALESALDPTVGGEVHIRLLFEPSTNLNLRPKLKIENFQVLKQIGEGGFSRVYKVRKRDTMRVYAMKVISKKSIASAATLGHVLAERAILQRTIDSPFLVSLKFSFQSTIDLFFVMDYKAGGDLFSHLQRTEFSEERTKFYAAEIVLGLSALHSANIIYRDLKPENCLLDGSGHLVLVDFGLSKILNSPKNCANTLCGTADYLAPEVLMGEYNVRADWWSLGVIIFEMITQKSPFHSESTLQLYENILDGPIMIPEKGSSESRDILSKLLERDPALRLGTLGSSSVQAHPFFTSISWTALLLRQISPPYKPGVISDSHDDLDYPSSSNSGSGVGDGNGACGLGMEEWGDTACSRRNSLSEESVDPRDIERKRQTLFSDFTFDAKFDRARMELDPSS